MLPVVSQDLGVSDSQFAVFVAGHRTFANILCGRQPGHARVLPDG
ncbi:hypothetical protein NGA35_06380 [Pseudomonas stutzeri]|nr:hypothetical protein [Stutzerimonas stutzeri]